MFFFFFNNEKRIGIKKLTNADLGLSVTSNQTHIGLYEGVFTFLNDSDVEKDGLLICNDSCVMLECLFDRIENLDGSYRSPKIRKGDNGNSIVDKIRDIARQYPNKDWYLVWSALESEQLVFWLFSNDSKDYQLALTIFPKMSMVLTGDNVQYENAKRLFQSKLNDTSLLVQKEIEIASQTGRNLKQYKYKDLEKANGLFKQIGKEGEQLIAEYLEKQKLANQISSYQWMNKQRESGAPFDFIVNEGLTDEHFVDVKSTRFDFEQYLYFSDDEIKFVNQIDADTKYSVYRIFDMDTTEKTLRICQKCSSYMGIINANINVFEKCMKEQQTILQSVKFGVKPSTCFKSINNPIIL